jgi:hypothetical protein
MQRYEAEIYLRYQTLDCMLVTCTMLCFCLPCAALPYMVQRNSAHQRALGKWLKELNEQVCFPIYCVIIHGHTVLRP